MSLDFKIRGRVYVRETEQPLAELIIRAYDRDLLIDDLLGDATTDNSGLFEILYAERDFKDLFEKAPDIYLRIYDSLGEKTIHTTADWVRWNAGGDEWFDVAVPQHKLPSGPDDTLLVDGHGRARTEFEAGEQLLIQLRALPPGRSVRISVLDSTGDRIVDASLVANRFGVIEPSVIWPDMGIGDPDRGGRYSFSSFEEAAQRLAGQRFTLEVNDGDATIRRKDFTFVDSLSRPRLYPVTKAGDLQRGLLLGSDDVRVRGRNIAPGSVVDIYLVQRQFDWRPGDPIVPISNLDGSEVVATLRLGEDETELQTTLWSSDHARPGSYDIILRSRLEHEYRADERLLRATDLISERFLTTLVIRDDIFRVKPVQLGCIAATREIAGKRLTGRPYFKFVNNFPRGTDVYAALDPAGVMPEAIGRKVRFYVVAHKDSAGWSASSDLVDVTGSVSEVITSPGCINANKALVWSNPQDTGKYDLVVDFGNNDPDPAEFEADDSFDPPLDMIDGYFNVGFYVTDDPSLPGTFPTGATTYDEPAVTIPAVGVVAPTPDGILGETPSGTLSLPLRAEVRYPAATAGLDTPVSTLETSYPLVVVMHGQHTTADPSYEGYTYLLDHLASHGFIAVSIDCNPINAISDGGAQDTRGHAMLEHLALLQSMNANPGLFQGKIDLSRIAIMGHSRGGDGAVQAEVFNQTLGLGFDIKAVVALAPTDFSGTTDNPLVLSTSKFLCIYGSNDGDVRGKENPSTQYTGTGFRFYDRATVEKAMVFIYGATHNRFNTEWGTEWRVDTSSPLILDTTTHKNLLKGYMAAFLQGHLQDRTEQLDYFHGDLRIPQVDHVEVFTQYRSPDPPPLTLDHFETAAPIDENTLGGDVSHSDLDGAPQENLLGTLDSHSPHQTRGLKLKWNAATARYESEIPLVGDQRNLAAYRFFSCRISQVVESMANPVDQTQDLYVRLSTAGGGNSRAVRAAYFGLIPFPYRPKYVLSADSEEPTNTKSALSTLRIPLHAWTIKCLSAPIVDLENVGSIALEFSSKPTGELLIDDIEFAA